MYSSRAPTQTFGQNSRRLNAGLIRFSVYQKQRPRPAHLYFLLISTSQLPLLCLAPIRLERNRLRLLLFGTFTTRASKILSTCRRRRVASRLILLPVCRLAPFQRSLFVVYTPLMLPTPVVALKAASLTYTRPCSTYKVCSSYRLGLNQLLQQASLSHNTQSKGRHRQKYRLQEG